MLNILLCRAHLQREKQAREDAERREKELHDRLQRFQDEAKAAQDGMENLPWVCTIRHNIS